MSKTAAPAKKAAPSKAKAADIDDLLGDAPAPKGKKAAAPAKADAAKPAAKKAAAPAKAEAPAPKGKKAAAKEDDDLLGEAPKGKKAAAEDKPAKAPRVREPIEFEDGEKDKLIKSIGKMVAKGPKASRDIAENLGIKTRKLRQVLYSMKRQGLVELELAGARAQGMTVTAAV